MGTFTFSVVLALCLVLHGWWQLSAGQKLCRVDKSLGLSGQSWEVPGVVYD